jgi:hypothetical protein
MAAQISLAIAIDIQLSDGEPVLRRTFPDARVDGLAAPRDVTRQTNVDRNKPCCQCSSQLCREREN